MEIIGLQPICFLLFVQLLLLELILRFTTVGCHSFENIWHEMIVYSVDENLQYVLRLLHLIGVIAVFTPFSNHILSWETILKIRQLIA